MDWLKANKDFSSFGFVKKKGYLTVVEEQDIPEPLISSFDYWTPPEQQTEIDYVNPPHARHYIRISIEGLPNSTIYYKFHEDDDFVELTDGFIDLEVTPGVDISVWSYQSKDGKSSDVANTDFIWQSPAEVTFDINNTDVDKARFSVYCDGQPINTLYYFNQLSEPQDWYDMINMPQNDVEYGVFWVLWVRERDGFIADSGWLSIKWMPKPHLNITKDYGLRIWIDDVKPAQPNEYGARIVGSTSPYMYSFFEDEDDPSYYRTLPILGEGVDEVEVQVTAIPRTQGFLVTQQTITITRRDG